MAYGTIDELNSFIGQAIRIAQKTIYTREDGGNCNREVHRYMAQLPNLLFYMARAANEREGIDDIEYARGTKVFKE